MSKSKKRHHKVKSEEKQKFTMSERSLDILFIILITVVLVFLMKPLVIDGLTPQGVDVVSSIGQSHQVKEYSKTSGEPSLWNPYIFSGMPTYIRLNARAFSIDTLLNLLGRFLNNIFVYTLFAGIGCYLLFRYLKMPPLISFFATLIYIMMPHFKALYLEGHYTKYRALMLLPWVFLSFLYFLDKRNLLSTALFALAFGIQIRTQHYQIIFYTALIIFAVGVYPILKDLFEKNLKRFSISVLLIVAALAFSFAISAQPLFLAQEYLPFSKRGKTTINLQNAKTTQNIDNKTDGVSIEYATDWSTHPTEMLTWLIPRFYGGMSMEKYTGDKVPQLKNRQLPNYWGYMPFTQSYEYMGVISLILSVIGIYAFRKNKLLLSLIFVTIFFILLSFGRHFQSFYAIFFNYFPYFNKFRAPMMSVTVVFFLTSIFAAHGLKYLTSIDLNGSIKKHRELLVILGSFFALGIFVWLLSSNFSFLHANDKVNQQAQVLDLFKSFRKELFYQDLTRYFILLIITSALLLGYLKKKLAFSLAAILLIMVTIFDLSNIQSRMQKQFIDVEKLEKQYFREFSTDRFLKSDAEIFRVFPMGNQLFDNNRWSYHHQSIGGYSPIKMYTIEELITNNLYQGLEKNIGINWNILKILNVKYIISQSKIDHQNVTLVHTDASGKLFTYIFEQRLPRGYFVESYRIISDEYSRLELLNKSSFDPKKVAILEEEPKTKTFQADSSSSTLTGFTQNEVKFRVFTNKTALFVFSELYYPPGWKIYIDDKQISKIYKTNHAVQSIAVPEGEHNIVLRFAPDSYYKNKTYASISLTILYMIILISLLPHIRKIVDNIRHKTNTNSAK